MSILEQRLSAIYFFLAKKNKNMQIAKVLLISLLLLFLTMCKTETAPTKETAPITSVPKITNYVNYNVINQENEDVKKIIENWYAYLASEPLVSYNNEFWTSPSGQICPTCVMRLIPMEDFKSWGKIQHTILGVIAVEENLWEVTSMFANIGDKEQILPHFILKVYAKKINGEYKFMNKIDYVKNKLVKERVGMITYYFDCDHEFDKTEATKLVAFNRYLSELFETPEIAFDYFICKDSRSISKLQGYEFEPSMYVPNQIGAITDEVNQIVYVGNFSEYYPHEVVHLYTKELFNYSYHEWIDEGLATMLGGSRGKELAWHLKELKTFLEANEDFELNDITKLNTVPNGKFTTEFRYVIGGLLVQEIYNKEGIKGVRNLLQYGSTNEDFYRLLNDKFNVTKDNFGDYIRKKLKEM